MPVHENKIVLTVLNAVVALSPEHDGGVGGETVTETLSIAVGPSVQLRFGEIAAAC
ncbi:MAG: hypothetical protein ACR2NR_00925 [Solirubrobacteraceae bacterium]